MTAGSEDRFVTIGGVVETALNVVPLGFVVLNDDPKPAHCSEETLNEQSNNEPDKDYKRRRSREFFV